MGGAGTAPVKQIAALFLIACLPVWALLNGADPNPERLATGGWQPALEGGASAMRENPALMGSRAGWEFGAGHTEAFGMEALPLWSAWGAYADSAWAVGGWLREMRAGEVFREDLVLASVALRRQKWSVGISGEAVGVAFGQGLGHAWSGDFSIGAQGRPLPWLSLGAALRQVLQTPVGASGEGLERDAAVGFAVETRDRRFATAVSLSGRTNAGDRPTWQVGQCVRPFPWLSLRGGIRLEPLDLSCGFGLEWMGAGLDASWSGEDRLGTQFALALRWRR